MTAKSPLSPVRTRELIGVDQFCQRREVYDKYDTVFMPPASPAPAMLPAPAQSNAEPNDREKTTNFKRNAPTHSSMRESRTEDRNIEFRTRKYSDNFYSESNHGDDVDYRYSMTERTRRLSKLRREFLKSNLHEPNTESPFSRSSARSTMPVGGIKYKIESPNLFKFPFAEPFATPPPVRRVIVDLDLAKTNGEKENQDPESSHKRHSLSNDDNTSPATMDQQRLFEELVKRYSPQRKPVDWKLPATKPTPRIVAAVSKSTSNSDTEVFDVQEKLDFKQVHNDENDVFLGENGNDIGSDTIDRSDKNEIITETHDQKIINGPKTDTYLAELEETNDIVPELSTIQSLSGPSKRMPSDMLTDLSIPALIEKISGEGDDLSKKSETKKIKRKRSFLDKLLGRKKDK